MQSVSYFRRQFIISPREHIPFPSWKKMCLGDYYVHTHPELACARVQQDDREILLLGYVFDASNPERTQADLLNSLARHDTFQAFNQATFDLAGTFVFIFHTPTELKLVHDAAGLREVYYAPIDGLWVASQPALLKTFLHLEEHTTTQARAFFASQPFRRSGHLTPTHFTVFQNVFHLMPNHYLDLSTGHAIRYWPKERLQRTPLEEASKRVADYLEGFVHSAARRYTLSLGVTAGWDSRLLLAASRTHQDAIHYFTIKHAKQANLTNKVDLKIAGRLSDGLGLPLSIRTYNGTADPTFQEAFTHSLTLGRQKNIPLWYHVFSKAEEMTLNGNVSEVARQYFERDFHVTPEKLSFLIYGVALPFAVEAYAQWLAEAEPFCKACQYDVLDLFYWEERMGNWAAKGRSEVQMATEMFSPFNCRGLLTLMLSVDAQYRGKYENMLYRQAIEQLWPKVLAEAFNPRAKVAVIKLMKRIHIYNIYTAIRRAVLGTARSRQRLPAPSAK